MNFIKKNNVLAALLTAFVLGLIINPFLYIAMGALFSFSLAFSVLMLPPLLIGATFLLRRYLIKPRNKSTNNVYLLLEMASWLAIISFIYFISNFKMQLEFEKIGLFCTLYTLALIISLPIALMRETALKKRLIQLPNIISIGILVSVFVLVTASIVVYFITAPTFL